MARQRKSSVGAELLERPWTIQFLIGMTQTFCILQNTITPEEAEEVVLDDPLELGFDRTVEGEDRWSYVGETIGGRVLQVVITMRGERIRVVTAFRPTTRDEISYLEYRIGRQ